jgi:hypothetical protein
MVVVVVMMMMIMMIIIIIIIIKNETQMLKSMYISFHISTVTDLHIVLSLSYSCS